MLKEVTPSVFNVYTQTRVRVRSPLLDDPIFRRFFNVPDVPRERVSQSLGSGVIVDAEKGYVLTNYHVIARADEIAVGLKDGRSLDAKLIGIDPGFSKKSFENKVYHFLRVGHIGHIEFIAPV